MRKALEAHFIDNSSTLQPRGINRCHFLLIFCWKYSCIILKLKLMSSSACMDINVPFIELLLAFNVRLLVIVHASLFSVDKSTYHNKRPRERFICFIRGAKWMKINRLNGPSLIHDTSTWLNQSIHSIRHVCCWLGMQKNLPWKCFRTAFGHYDFPSTSSSPFSFPEPLQIKPSGSGDENGSSQQAWRMRKRYHLLLVKPLLIGHVSISRKMLPTFDLSNGHLY